MKLMNLLRPQILLSLIVSVVSFPALAQQTLPALEALQASGMRVGAYFSVDGKPIATLNPDLLLNPASVTKLFTAAIATERIGPDRRFRTSVFTAGDGTLYVEGSGDPELTVRELDQLASCVAGVSKGPFSRLVFSTGPFDRSDLPPAYGQKDTSSAYRASVAGLQVNRNAVAVSVGKAAPGETPAVKVTPSSDYVRVVNSARASSSGKEGVAQRRRDPLRMTTSTDKDGRLVVTISGRSNPAKAVGRTFRVDNPAWNAASAFIDSLKKRGVSVKAAVPVRGNVPVGAERICFVMSPRLADILVPMLKDSINPVAESVLRLVGARAARGQVGFGEGAAALMGFLNEDVKVPEGSCRFTNGSGLYGANKVSAAATVALVDWILGSKDVRPVIARALPVGGVDGTLQGRFRGETYKGRVHAKTGTLDVAISLAGWVDLPDGRAMSFAVLVEGDSKLNSAQVRGAIDSSVMKAAEGAARVR